MFLKKWQKKDLKPLPKGWLVAGLGAVPPTTWWNRWYLKLLAWKWVVFKIPDANAILGYQIGFIPESGSPEICTTPIYEPTFQVRIGHEECRFFAIDSRGEEVPLTIIGWPSAEKRPNTPAF